MSRAMSTSDKQTKVVWEGTEPTNRPAEEDAKEHPRCGARGSGSKTKDGKNGGTEATVHLMGENGKKIIGGKVDSTWCTFSGGRFKPYYQDKE
ncbi:hypothetical protein LTR17_014315 [Elasticomyces elasticus]|nr:hypothetical protein LTR17_014315 [Elasticomyces elasticus]